MDGHAPHKPTPLKPEGVGIHEAKTNLSKLVARAEAGEEVVITRGGVPVAKLVAAAPKTPKFGFLKGKLNVPDEFFDPLPDEYLGEWPGD